MELRDYIRVARRRWRAVVAVLLLTVAVTAVVTAWTEPRYQAKAQLYVSTVSAENPTDLAQGSTFTQRQVTTYADIATTPLVLVPVIEELDLETTPRRLANSVTTTALANTVLLDITVVDPDPTQALAIAGAVSDQLVLTLSELDRVDESTASPVKATIVTPATVGGTPVSPQPTRAVALAIMMGLLLGVGVAFLRDLLDNTVRNEEHVRNLTDAPVLGVITFDKAAAADPMMVVDKPHHTHSEAFRTLRTNLQFVNAGDPPRSIVLTSSLPEEGKTTTTAHLALTLSATGKRVCVIEGDLRRPQLMEYLGMEGSAGLTNVLIGEAELDDMLQPYAQTNLTLLGSGPIPPNPAELLGSDHMRRVLADLTARFDTVIIDAPPLLPVTDAAVLAGIADGAIVIVGSGVIKNEHLVRTLKRLHQAQAQLLGLIINRLPTTGAYAYYYAYDAEYSPRHPLHRSTMPTVDDEPPVTISRA